MTEKAITDYRMLVFLAVMEPKQNILDEPVFVYAAIENTQTAIDLAITLDLHQVPAHVSIGESETKSQEIFTNKTLQLHDKLVSEAITKVKSEEVLGELGE